MSAATSPGRVWTPPAGLRGLGHGPLLVLRHDLRPATPSSRRQSVGDRSPRLGPGAAGGDRRPTWRHRPGRARATARSGLGFGSVATSGLALRENNLLSPHRCRRRGGKHAHAPNLMWGTDGAGVHGGDGPPSSIGTPSVSAGMSASAATASPPCSRSPWGLPGCMARPRPARLGGWPCGWITAPVSVGPLHQPDQVLGHPAVLRLRRRAPDQRRRRAVQSHAEGTDHPWSHLPQHRGAAGRRPRLRRTLQCPVDRRKERLPEPRSSSSGVARRDLNQARL